MSLYGALYAGVAGLSAQSNKLGIISDNISNVNTVGYKQGQSQFQTLVTGTGNVTAYSPGGVLGGNRQLVSKQGLLQSTTSPTDIALSGSGFFVVNQSADGSGSVLYTRAGSFTQDATGNFYNSAGFYLQAWPLDRNGLLPGQPGNLNTTSSSNLSSLETVNVKSLTGTASSTTSVSIGANLKSSQVPYAGAAVTARMDILDSANYGINASSVIVPTGVNSLTRGDEFTVTTGSGLSYTYTYGGFTYGRNITDGTVTGVGDNGQALMTDETILNPSATTLDNSVKNVAIGGIATNNGTTRIDVTVASTANLVDGDWVTIAGLTTDVGGIAFGDINGTWQIVVDSPTQFHFISDSVANATSDATSTETATSTGAPIAIGAQVAGHTLATIKQTYPATWSVGDWVTLDAGTIDGINLNGTFQITALDPNGEHFTIDTLQTAASGNMAGGTSGTITTDMQPISTTNGSPTVRVYQPGHGLTSGDVVTLSTVPSGGVGGISQANLSRSYVVTVVDANHYHFTAVDSTGTPVNATSSAGGGTATTVESRPFAGNIFDAINASQPFFGTTGTAGFRTAALSFTISSPAIPAGTATFTYTPSAPNAQLGQFNNLNNLAAAISAVSGLTARVVNDRLYVGATDATQSINFTNGETEGTSGPPVQAGIDWVRELGFDNISAATGRYSSLQGLADLVNDSTGMNATINNPLGAATLTMNVNDPLDTVSFTNGGPLTDNNTGSPLAALGILTSLNGNAYVPGASTGALGPAYDPTVSAKSIAGGGIAAQFSRPVTVYDALGTPHNLNIGFIKTASNRWAVEIYAQPAGDVTSTNGDGQIAYGNITFNGDGSLQSIDTSLSQAIGINWTNGASGSNLMFNWGTAGQPFGTPNAAVIGLTDGLSQFDSGYNVGFVDQNGAPVGQLTGISIDELGFITASYSNGETQKLYKIPIADFTNANALQSISGNSFSQTSASGEVNLREAGTSGVGTLVSGALEASNVELAEQLTDMIVAQRAYQANTKVISTADSLLESLDAILR